MGKKFLIVLLMLVTGKVGSAQVFSDQLMFLQSQMQFMTIQSQIYSDMSLQNMGHDEANKKKAGKGSPSSKYGSNGFSYTGNKAIIDRVEKEIIARLASKNPASGKNLETALSRDRPYSKYIAAFKALGLDPEHDYADVFTGYMLGMWRIANGMATNPTKEQIIAVRNQVVNNLDISGLSNQERQEKAAYLIYDLIFANEAYEGSRKANNRKLLQQDADAVQQRFLRENKLDLRTLSISENGLVRNR